MKLREHGILFLATGCFIGKMPVAPGTFGSLPGLVICFFLSGLEIWIAISCTLLLIIFSIWMSHEGRRILKQDDPGCIVIDEIAGMTVVLAGLPFEAAYLVTGFIIFRILDVLKPFPIRMMEQELKGGLGIVMDDVAAGVLGNIILRIIFYLKPCVLS